MENFNKIVDFVKLQFSEFGYCTTSPPQFNGNEKAMSMKQLIWKFLFHQLENCRQDLKMMYEITGSNYVTVIVNGTSALHMALLCAFQC